LDEEMVVQILKKVFFCALLLLAGFVIFQMVMVISPASDIFAPR